MDLVTDLGSDDIAEREDAMRILSEDQTLTLSQLEGLLKRTDLSAEQRCRINQAAKQRFMTSPRPALGVQFDNRLPDRVVIERIYDKFPALGLLEPGDMIVSCNGERLRSRSAWLRLGAHIFSREPGETISVVVRRGAEKLEMEIPLGKFSDLEPIRPGAGRAPSDDRLERAWEMRCGRLTEEKTEVIEAAVPASAWDIDYDPDVQAMNQKSMRYNGVYRPRLVAGGEARGGEPSIEEIIQLSQRNPGALNNRNIARQLAQQGVVIGWVGGDGLMLTAQQELSILEEERAMLQRQAAALKAPQELKPGQLTEVAVYRAQNEKMLTRVNRQIEAIKADTVEEQAKSAQSEATVRDGK